MSRPTVFDELYRSEPDPWGIEASWYERRKRALLLASLRRERYGLAFEPGCGQGVLTAALAPRCDSLHSTDLSPVAIEQARLRLAGTSNVELAVAELPGGWPEGPLDLIVLSEVLYFLEPSALRDVVERTVASLAPGGDLVLVDYTGPIEGYPLDGRTAHAAFRAIFSSIVCHEDEGFVLEVLSP